MKGVCLILFCVLLGCNANEKLHVKADLQSAPSAFSGFPNVSTDIVLEIDTNKYNSWSEIFTNLKGDAVLLMQPGDYRKWGSLLIRPSSTISSLAIRYYDASAIDPYLSHSNPINLPSEKKVYVENFNIRGTYSGPPGSLNRREVEVTNVLLYGLDISGLSNQLSGKENETSPDYSRFGGLANRIEIASNIIVENCLIENVIGKNSIRVNSRNTSIISNIIRNCFRLPNRDNIGVSIHSDGENGAKDILIKNNEIYNCTDCIQIVTSDERRSKLTSNIRILDNDLYVDSSYYVASSNGILSSTENGIDVKLGSISLNSPTLIANNRIHGMRRTDTFTGGSGSNGAAISLTLQARNVKIYKNIIYDVPEGIVSAPGSDVSDEPNIEISDNLIFDLYSDSAFVSTAIRLVSVSTVRDNIISNTGVALKSPYQLFHKVVGNQFINISDNQIWSKYHQELSSANEWINPPMQVTREVDPNRSNRRSTRLQKIDTTIILNRMSRPEEKRIRLGY